jgi:3-hydroxyacyl-CoA dehydrogenase
VNYRLDGEVAVLTIDNPPVNALSLAVREALLQGLQRAEHEAGVQAIVVTGADGTFCAGADINEVASGLVQAQMEAASKPIVAAIEGVALGGGFELALACHWRIAARGAKVGLPEVKLGLIPGAGGTQRFTRLAGPEAALESITAGAQIPAARSLALGLLDGLADPALAGALALARQAVAEKRPLRITSELSERIRRVSPDLFATFRRKLEPKARGQLAPWRIVDSVEAACTLPKEAALAREREYFIECRDSPQRQALVHVFFAEREARKIPGLDAQVTPLPIRRAAVVGAGTMGTGIAMTFANAGIPVSVLELSGEALERGLGLIARSYEGSVARGSLTRERTEQALALIRGVSDYQALGTADLIIEAVFEDLKVKQQVFARLDQVAAPHAVLASNTSTLDIDMIAASTSRPQQVVGTHFFSPANVMKLLENVRGTHTSPQTIATVMTLARTLGKIAVLAGNCDGFIGNRMLMFYGAEAEFLLEEGATPEQIDRVIEGFGFAMGPLAVRDLAGNDVGLAIRKGRRLPPDERFSPILERLVGEGRLGQKSGKGFYRYEGRTRIPDLQVLALIEGVSRDLGIQRRQIPDEEILDRLLHPLVNEGARIVEEGIAIRASDVDVVYVNGYGFPAYKGGPMYWAQQAGLARVVHTMRRLAPTHGARWRPAALLERLASSGKGWPGGVMSRALTVAVITAMVLMSAAHADTPADKHHAAPAVPASVAQWAHGASLFQGLGDFHRAVTTSVPLAQQYFDQGMRLLWAFNHDESTRSFARAAELDPACAACYWGVALTVGPNYNLPAMAEPRARVAWEALHKAQENAAPASPVEQALIGALAARYPAPQPPAAADSDAVLSAYATAMRSVAERFPDDPDVQTLCAESEMNVHAWKLWTADGQPVAGTLQIEKRLESVLQRSPGHPGANHYYIHVMEASPDPGKALASAERLRSIMPAAGHLEHMPAHIMQRVGRYEDAAEANRRGVAADEAYFRTTPAPDYYRMYLAHNYAFLAFSAAMEGRKAETLAAVQSVLQTIPLDMTLAMGDSGWSLTQQYAALVRFGLWDEMIAQLAPDPRASGLTAGYLYGRGVALAARGRLDEAKGALAALQQLGGTVPADAAAGFNMLRDVLNVAQPIVAARIAASEERSADAITLLGQAVAAEDRLSYNEPADWFFPARHLLGAQLLLGGQATRAEQVYREDLRHNPGNGWALQGLAAALTAQGRAADAAHARHELHAAWRYADLRLPGSAFWFAGADSSDCACQHQLR